ncbi:hypothetical protein BD311DRAFT_495792 [Dichomitus squalens]|uniref:Uncharacterized protein n=1 Tax=Dichomitus squalens TaxID=114155 RepID=A0A4Q9PSE8_9APHY|nr:hypothetical protein BD311DRAFT_495792 [Dichomitus squalens]TBU57357.1 hypothetical protein BD310DRAFT_556873 [Dichomitus squalens]
MRTSAGMRLHFPYLFSAVAKRTPFLCAMLSQPWAYGGQQRSLVPCGPPGGRGGGLLDPYFVPHAKRTVMLTLTYVPAVPVCHTARLQGGLGGVGSSRVQVGYVIAMDRVGY